MHKKSAGFSLPEVILIVAVLAIISGMAFPDMASFFARQRLEQERTELEQIKKAMEVYARQCGGLPTVANNPVNCREPGSATTATWFEALASVSNLSASEIEMDTWGVRRIYTQRANTGVTFLGSTGNMAFHYATVRSIGPNRCDDTNAPTGQASCPPNFAFNSNPTDAGDGWTIEQYGAYTTKGDDMIVKFTDNQIKAAAYEETLRRLERVIAALDRYAQAKFNEAIVTTTNEIERECLGSRVFYPRSGSSNSWTPAIDCNGDGVNDITSYAQLYPDSVSDDVANIVGSVFLGTDDTQDDTRKTAMQGLMRLLGLPLDHCCSALDDRAFFYLSSPGVDSGGCIYPERPPYFPPKVLVAEEDGPGVARLPACP